MPRMLRSTLGLGLALLASGAMAQAATGDGLPVPYDGAGLAVVEGGEALARVDLGSFDVSEPAAPAPDAAGSGSDDSAMPWGLIAGGGALLIVAAALIRTRRGRDDAEERELERLVNLERSAEGEPQAREREPVR